MYILIISFSTTKGLVYSRQRDLLLLGGADGINYAPLLIDETVPGSKNT